MQNNHKQYRNITITLFAQTSIFSGECGAGLHCKQRHECPAFKEEEAKLDAMTSLTPEWEELASQLTDMKCDGVENGVCCKSNRKGEASTENVKVILFQANVRKVSNASPWRNVPPSRSRSRSWNR